MVQDSDWRFLRSAPSLTAPILGRLKTRRGAVVSAFGVYSDEASEVWIRCAEGAAVWLLRDAAWQKVSVMSDPRSRSQRALHFTAHPGRQPYHKPPPFSV